MSIKTQLHTYCLSYVEQRIKTSLDAIAQAQASANEETRSSAGDKYETGRAMMQIEIEKNLTQLNEAQKLKRLLQQIDPKETHILIKPGSVVSTNLGKFYMAISAGSCTVDQNVYTTISPSSPLGAQMVKLSSGAQFGFMGKQYVVLEVN